jgi:hypothetical protein
VNEQSDHQGEELNRLVDGAGWEGKCLVLGAGASVGAQSQHWRVPTSSAQGGGGGFVSLL